MGNVLVNDAYLYGIADALREKHDTEKKYLPSEMEDAVRGIQSGGSVDWFQYASSIQGMFSSVTFPENTEIELNVPNVKNLGGTFQNSLNVKKVKIKGNVNGNAVRLNSCFWGASNLETIDFSEFKCTFSDMSTAFRSCTSLKYIYGEFDCTSTTTLGGFLMLSSAVEYIRFKKETISVSLDLGQSPKLTDETIQNIIDGLADLTGQTAQTLALHNNVKDKIRAEQRAQATSKNWNIA